jgi:methylenetetrahydrofolate dehydrogenase (NADP+)/methenyltetrahydrofolate cyclohydrolase
MVLILDGKKIRDQIADKLKKVVHTRVKEGFVRPSLAIIQVGNNKESEAYIRNKKKFGERIGAEVIHVHLPEESTEESVLGELQNLNQDENIHGIIIQLPLPKGLDKNKLIETIDPKKDVDGLCSKNVKGLWTNQTDTMIPATTRGILTILEHYQISVAGKNIVIVGRSSLVGRPTAVALLNRDATVTICHSLTKDLEYHTLEADIIISAAGRPRLITEAHVKPHHIIIDVGITVEEIPERVSHGDVDFVPVSSIVDAISPVPGGVGPMTVASLFENLIDAYNEKIRS